MECPVFPSTRKGVPAGISRILLVIYHAWEGWILTSPLLEQHRVIHSHTTNRDGLKQGTPSPLFGQELNSARAPGGRWRGSGRGSIHPQPSPAQPVTHILLSAQRARAGNLGGAQVFAHGTPPHSRRVRDEWEIV